MWEDLKFIYNTVLVFAFIGAVDVMRFAYVFFSTILSWFN